MPTIQELYDEYQKALGKLKKANADVGQQRAVYLAAQGRLGTAVGNGTYLVWQDSLGPTASRHAIKVAADGEIWDTTLQSADTQAAE